ncbi:hypothetical protein FA95DRAFT_1592122 [Auriscalpium vulgare]|uniref:Uncharacterized protein n=1 Tax=Auriscalpium vulgare TaxID=40419 RepID=A0ACB8SAV4_9AGAM|nr:hypothetical protein FA95DRAFT_1592122 [Auriscalpium vulgare]
MSFSSGWGDEYPSSQGSESGQYFDVTAELHDRSANQDGYQESSQESTGGYSDDDVTIYDGKVDHDKYAHAFELPSSQTVDPHGEEPAAQYVRVPETGKPAKYWGRACQIAQLPNIANNGDVEYVVVEVLAIAWDMEEDEVRSLILNARMFERANATD